LVFEVASISWLQLQLMPQAWYLNKFGLGTALSNNVISHDERRRANQIKIDKEADRVSCTFIVDIFSGNRQLGFWRIEKQA
jgi:hypothetical protein